MVFGYFNVTILHTVPLIVTCSKVIEDELKSHVLLLIVTLEQLKLELRSEKSLNGAIFPRSY